MKRQYIASTVIASASLVFSLAAVALAGTAVYRTPASEDDMAIESFWGPPADGALHSGGMEADLDGNASALVASDWGTTPATGTKV